MVAELRPMPWDLCPLSLTTCPAISVSPGERRARRLVPRLNRLPDRQSVAGGSDIVRPYDAGAVLYRDKSGGNACRQTVVGRPTREPAQARFPGPPGEDRDPDIGEIAQAAQQLEIVLQGLAEPEARVDHDPFALDAA